MMTDNFADGIKDVIVLGAGIVGVSAAVAARQQGLSAVLVDRREPGSETSYGNAGVLSSGSILPLNKPSLWNALPAYITNRHAALRWDPIWTIRNIGWVARFLGNARTSRTKPRAAALHGLIEASLKLHREWIVEAGAAHRIRESGWLKVWRSNAVETAKQEQAFVEGRIQELERMLSNAKVIEEPTTGEADYVRMGSHIKVGDSEGEEETYYLVGSHEADPRRGLISNESPIGRALIGKRVGDEVTVVAPAGAFNLKILEIT